MALPQAAIRHYQDQQLITIAAAEQVDAMWRTMTDDFELSWLRIAPDVFEVTAAAQLEAAATGIEYVPAVLEEQDLAARPVAEISEQRFVGGTRDGRPLETLLHGAVYEAKAAIGAGLAVREALTRGGEFLQLAVMEAVRDADRQAVAAEYTVRPEVGGWVRMMNPPSCKFCIVLSGKFYRWNQGFQSHPECFPAGVAVSGPSVEAATRRWYEGELVVLTTASGQELPVTGNHPVLTSRGWVPANLIREGDEVVRSTRPNGAASLVVPDHDQMPARIEDVWRSLSMHSLVRVEAAPEDFHGDGQHGQVDVVRADRSLNGGIFSARDQKLAQKLLAVAARSAAQLGSQSASELLDLWKATLSGGPVRRGDLLPASLFGQTRIAGHSGFAHSAALYTGFGEKAADRAAGYPVLSRQAVLGRSGQILGDDLLSGKRDLTPRWDAPGATFSGESVEGYARVGSDLLQRLAGQVELDRVVHTVSRDFRGHVYSLNSSEGWHVANSLIVSNCDCRHIPSNEAVSGDLAVDPYAYFRSLSEHDQNRLFGKNDAQAIRDGGDVYRVVNVRSRGLSSDALKSTGDRRGWQSRRWNSPSLMTVDDVYASARSRDHAIRLLEENGFITGEQVAGGNLRGNTPSEFGELAAGALGRGGTRKGATAAYRQAVRSGVRDPLEPATQTAAERRLHSAVLMKRAVDRGSNPYGRGPLTPEVRDLVDRQYRRELDRLDDGPEQLRVLARLLGVA